MQAKIDTLTKASESLRNARLALENLKKQEAELKAALEKLQAQLAQIPMESLALAGGDDKAFDRPTSRMVSSRDDIRTKLDLLPGVRVRFQAQAAGLSLHIRVAVRALTHHCRDLASAKMEKEQAELAT